jgi:hypothetical protein
VNLAEVVAAVSRCVTLQAIVLELWRRPIKFISEIVVVPAFVSFFRDFHEEFETVDEVVGTSLENQVVNDPIRVERTEEEADFVDNADVASGELDSNEAVLSRRLD